MTVLLTRFRKLSPRSIALTALASLAVIGGIVAAIFISAKTDEAEAAPPRHHIAVFLSSPENRCYDTAQNKAIRQFISTRIAEINKAAGLGGQKYDIDFYDDQQDPKQSIANIRRAIANPQTVAMIGLPGWRRAKTVFEQIGREIGDSKIPFLSDISVNRIFADQQNVFTIRASQEDERLPVIARLLADTKALHPAFVARAEEEASDVLGNGLKSLSREHPMAADLRIKLIDNKLGPGEVTSIVADLKAKAADFLILSLGNEANGQLLKEAAANGLTVPILMFGNAEQVMKNAGLATYPNAIYQLAFDSLPGLFNDRLRQRILRLEDQSWIFEDTRNLGATGWLSGACKPKKDEAVPQRVFDGANLRSINRGTEYADMVSLVAEIVRRAGPGIGAIELRQHIVNDIKSNFATGRGAFRGQFDNWSFRPSTRTASRTPVIVMRPRNSKALQLAPNQYVRLRNDALRKVETLYLDIDLVRLYRVDDNEKSFFADFYLSLNDNGKYSADSITFANAFVDPDGGGSKLVITPLHEGGPSDAYPENTKIYQVSGKFMFRPDFSRYPFDTQLFSIELQPKRGDTPFLIQPPPPHLRDPNVATDGWMIDDRYVAYDEDFIPIIDARSDEKSVVPFYKGSFAWVMTREATDYYLRVVVPLGFILIVAYLSIFIPKNNFEAIVTIQVTALLSAVALYLAIPKIGTDTATLSDRIFLFDYMAVSLMIGISILRVNPFLERRPRLGRILDIVHIVGIPVMVVAMAVYVLINTIPPAAAGGA